MTEMIQIDIDADLQMEDDEERNFARLPADNPRIHVGAVAIAGRPGLWSWVLIDEIDGDIVFFHQIDRGEAEEHGQLVLWASTPAARR